MEIFQNDFVKLILDIFMICVFINFLSAQKLQKTSITITTAE